MAKSISNAEVEQVIVQGPIFRADAGAVWANSPTLGRMDGQTYLGRIVVEVLGDGAHVAFIGADEQLRERAIAALQATKSSQRQPAVWPREPIMGGSPSGQVYRGRVVAEFWSATTNIVTSAQDTDLVKRAVETLRGISA